MNTASFFTSRADCPRLRSHRILQRGSKRWTVIYVIYLSSGRHISIIDLSGLDIISGIFDLSVSRKVGGIRSQSPKILKCVIFMALIFWILACVVQQMSLQFMIEKPQPDLLTQLTTFYDLSVSCNLFWKDEMRRLGASGSPRIWDCREPTG